MLEKRVEKLEAQRETTSNDFQSVDQEIAHYQQLMTNFERSGLLPRYRALKLRELPEPELEKFLIHARKARADSLRAFGSEPEAFSIDPRTTSQDIYDMLANIRRRQGGDRSKQTGL